MKLYNPLTGKAAENSKVWNMACIATNGLVGGLLQLANTGAVTTANMLTELQKESTPEIKE